MPRLPFLLCLLLLPAAPARAAAEPEAEPSARRGEAFTFSLKLGPIEGGRARMAIAPPHREGDRLLVNVVGEAEAVGLVKLLTRLRDDYRLVLDADTFLPRTIHVVETGLSQRTLNVELAGRKADILVTRKDAQRRLLGVLPVEVHDPVTALLALRAARLFDGDRLELVVLDGSAFYRGWIDVAGREELELPQGRRRVVRLSCSGERVNENGIKMNRPLRHGTIWLSDDAQRVPLRIEGETDFGKARFELTSYEPPKKALKAPAHLPGLAGPV